MHSELKNKELIFHKPEFDISSSLMKEQSDLSIPSNTQKNINIPSVTENFTKKKFSELDHSSKLHDSLKSNSIKIIFIYFYLFLFFS